MFDAHWVKAKKFVGWKFGQNMSNLFSGVMHNHNLVWWEKNLTQLGHAS
jgi:hypothetical protein